MGKLLKVECHLATPIATIHRPHLDSLLLAAACPDAQINAHEPRNKIPPHPPMPMAKVEALGDWVWAASAAMFLDEPRPGLEHSTKRPDSEDLQRREGRWMPNTGPERARCFPVPTVETAGIFWLVWGDAEDIANLLDRIDYVGGFRRHGYGRVRGWRIEEPWIYLDAQEILQAPDGELRRHLPGNWVCEPVDQRLAGPYQPPYWLQEQPPRAHAGEYHTLRDEVLHAPWECIKEGYLGAGWD